MKKRLSLLTQLIIIIAIALVSSAYFYKTITSIQNEKSKLATQKKEEFTKQVEAQLAIKRENQPKCKAAGEKYVQRKQELGMSISALEYNFNPKINKCLVSLLTFYEITGINDKDEWTSFTREIFDVYSEKILYRYDHLIKASPALDDDPKWKEFEAIHEQLFNDN